MLKELKLNRSFVLCCAGMTASTFVLGGVATVMQLYVFEREARFTLDAKAIDRLQTKTFVLPAPGPRFAARVIIDAKFVPHNLDPSNGDTRQLGAVVTYRFVPGPAPQAAHK